MKYDSCQKSAENGDLECLKYAHDNGYQWNKWTPANAAKNGHLECLKYAHDNGCPWDEYTTSYAALYKGNIECLKYAHENGCPWNFSTMVNAINFYNVEGFKYFFQNWNNPQEIWNLDFYLHKVIDKIDLDDKVWRKLFNLDLSKYPDLQIKIENKKKEIEDMKKITIEELNNILPLDIIKYCIYSYF